MPQFDDPPADAKRHAPADAKRHAPVDAKRHAPATLRNRGPILDVLGDLLPATGAVLEVGAGSGEHAACFAAALTGLSWQPSDLEPENLASIAAWATEAAAPGLRPPIRLDLQDPAWPELAPCPVDAVVCINVLHIAPWAVCEGLMAGAARLLAPAGMLYLYGPFMLDGRHTAPSNAAFDASLRAGDPSFGIRDLGEVADAAAVHGLVLERRIAMPANNLSVVFRKRTERG
jgi:SAM-dependent methyltransferase